MVFLFSPRPLGFGVLNKLKPGHLGVGSQRKAGSYVCDTAASISVLPNQLFYRALLQDSPEPNYINKNGMYHLSFCSHDCRPLESLTKELNHVAV
jgi:hypothetical protein